MAELGSHAYLAFAAGLLSVLSPCVLPLMPAYLSLISGISVEEMRGGALGERRARRVMQACLGSCPASRPCSSLLGASAPLLGQRAPQLARQLLGVEFGVCAARRPARSS